jgi:hypothetical protein
MYFFILLFFSYNVFAQTYPLEQVALNRATLKDKLITVEGIISTLKDKDKKNEHYYEIKLVSKFDKNNLKLEYYTRQFDKVLKAPLQCKVGQIINVTGNFYATIKGDYLGVIKAQDATVAKCRDDDSYMGIKDSLVLSTLEAAKENYNLKNIRISGYVKDLKISKSLKQQKAKFVLFDPNKKTSVRVDLLLQKDDFIVNEFSCAEAQLVKITGPFIASKSKGNNLGSLKIISKEQIECLSDKMVLSASEQQKLAQRENFNTEQTLKLLFAKYKNFYSGNSSLAPEEINAIYKEMIAICETGIKDAKLGPLCIQISYYARTMDQRNQLSFKIQSAKNNFADWGQLNSYVVSEKNSILEIIKALYPNNSDYIIGIPERCYPNQQFNPAASNFPYGQLSISQYAKDNFTAILNRFNDSALKCGNLLDSIYIIGNMDNDPELEVITLDLNSKRFFKIIKSDL